MIETCAMRSSFDMPYTSVPLSYILLLLLLLLLVLSGLLRQRIVIPTLLAVNRNRKCKQIRKQSETTFSDLT